MSRKYKIRDQNALCFVTFTVVNWLDVFTRTEYRDIFLDSIRYCQKNKGLEVCAYCPDSYRDEQSHSYELIKNEFIDQKLDYIHNNPVEAGLVLSPEHYYYSSAINYADLPEKLIDVSLI